MQYLTFADITAFEANLWKEERSAATVEKYGRDLRAFLVWLAGRAVTKEVALAWREYLLGTGLSAKTVNAKLSALNGLFQFLGWHGCRARVLRVQRRVYQEEDRELTKEDYQRLCAAAMDTGRERLALLMETICAAGIRVSEVRFITVEAARAGRVEIRMKGKVRSILLSAKLRGKLLKYAKKERITFGEIFRTRNGTPINRKQIWSEMKALCQRAGVESSKVFPHNLRHLFATTFYRVCRDIVKLADVLGHSSIETTRIYLMTTGKEHARLLERLALVT